MLRSLTLTAVTLVTLTGCATKPVTVAQTCPTVQPLNLPTVPNRQYLKEMEDWMWPEKSRPTATGSGS